ncbi:MAG: hypothetical protein P4M15_08370 [Alphaproteobacteria bacterium]|nr:hypothetical protein [Alphaproteobacteria bacterium]
MDLSVALKTLPLLTNKITGPTSVAIIYDPSNTESKADAERIKSIIDGGLQAPGDIKLITQLTSASDLSGLAAAKIAFLAQGMRSAACKAVAGVAASAGTLTISTNLDCVKANQCVLGIVSKPQVEVYFSPVAAEATKIGFASAFTMLTKQAGSM